MSAIVSRRYAIYGVLLAVLVGSLAVGLAVPAESIVREISAIPAIGALFAALFQVFRDQAAFERQMLIQQQQQTFSLGAASHMASVAFDKHAAFCEKYMAEVHLTVTTLFREGPTPNALKHAGNLARLKGECTAWLPREIMSGLEPFEKALRRIGALSHLVFDTRGTGDPERAKAIKEMYEVFRDVMAIGEAEMPDARTETTIEAVEDRVRAILGIDQLTTMRQRLIEQAMKSFAEPG